MLRRARWLILLALLALAGTFAFLFIRQRSSQRHNRPQLSAPLPSNTSALAERWKYELTSGNRSKIIIFAKTFRQIKEPALFELEGLEMEIHAPDAPRFHVIRSAKARMDQESGLMVADGEVDIELNHSEKTEAAGRILKIRTSAATLDIRSSRVSTEQKATFEFDHGSGECLGAIYDPSTKLLDMKSQAVIDYRAKDPAKPPMRLEAGHLTYREGSSLVHLESSAKLTRGPFELIADSAVVFLQKDALEHVEAQQAHGTDSLPARHITYQARYLNLFFAEKGELKKVEASEDARLASVSPNGRLDSTANRFDLFFLPGKDGSTLQRSIATGHARLQSTAAPRPGNTPGPRLLTSEIIETTMRPGGKEIDKVLTHAPGQVEFLPAKPADRKRTLNGERLTLEYAPGNAIRYCRAVTVTTRTEGLSKEGKPTLSTTRSRDFQADFDPQSGQLTRMEQWNDFQYEEGLRRASADRALFDPAREQITLAPKGRLWDDTGSTAADNILLDQRSGDMLAQGNVTSTRLPKPKTEQPANPGLLTSSEPIQARAQRLTSTERGSKLRYEGDAVLWQSNRRLQAQQIAIDQALKSLEANGNVISEFPDQSHKSQDPKSPRRANAFTVVRAPAMTYSDQAGVAHYTGGATLTRPTMNVKADQIHGYFAKEPKTGGGEENRLDHAFADGAVTLVENVPGRPARDGAADHAEYYLSDERVILTGGNPVVNDAKRGTTRGALITWYSREDRLTVDNSGAGPAVSRMNQKAKKK